MFTFLVQVFDVLALQRVGLFLVFFIMSWTIHLTKLYMSRKYRSVPIPNEVYDFPAVSIVIPVVDEKPEVWHRTLCDIEKACDGLEHQIIVVANGEYSEQNACAAKQRGFELVKISQASKRLAIEAGTKLVKHPITIILDSDTFATPDSIKNLLLVFQDAQIGGATPKHEIFNREPLMRRISDWLEDLRFNEVLKGQSVNGAVSCLPGRMFAIRTLLLRSFVSDLATQTFLGAPCYSGDDRYLTSRLLKERYQTVYQAKSLVYTDAPDTLKGFAKQRLRWSRTSLRETVLSVPWTFRYPYMTYTVFANVILRWFFFAVTINAISIWVGFCNPDSFLWQQCSEFNTPLFIVSGATLGFIISGFLRQLGHLFRYPEDILYLPAFLIITTFVLTPVEWYGHLSLRKTGWMTRRVEYHKKATRPVNVS
jgi:cellulose synthase/poly-beta-1,6-N-acetylglucosamine synthase-like glycosyltransferase